MLSVASELPSFGNFLRPRFALTSGLFDDCEYDYDLYRGDRERPLQFISGVIAKLAPGSVFVVTPVATIAVRGTRFLVSIPKKDG